MKRPLEIIKWYDITGSSEWGKKNKPVKCKTAGWVIKKKKKYLLVASSKSGKVYGDTTAIPIGCIRKRVIQ